MKPNFALSLFFDKVELLHRTDDGWDSVGTVAFDAEDLPAELSALRKTALSRDPEGLRTKLILPDEQVKFLSLEDEKADDKAVRDALADATPYDLDDLVFEATSDGRKTHIAAVAQETLDEAEAFAVEHRFAPVSIVARIDKFRFDGEPFFGATKAAKGLIGPDDTIERDSPPAALAEPEPKKEASKPKKKAPAKKDSEKKADAKPESDDKTKKAPAKEKKESKPKTAAKEKPAVKEADKPEPGAIEEPAFASRDRKAPAPETPDAKAEPPITATTTSRITPAPMVETPPAKPVEPRTVPQPVPPRPAPGTPPPAVAERLARIARTDVAAMRPTDMPAAKSARVPDLPSDAPGKAPAVATPTTPPKPKDLAATLKRGNDTSKGASEGSGLFASRRKKGDPSEADTAVAAKAPAAAKATAKDRSKMTVFDERDQSPARGKPRFMLPILIAILLLFMAVAAAFAAIFTDQGLAGWLGFGSTQPEPTEVAAPLDDTPLSQPETPEIDAEPVLTIPADTDPTAPDGGTPEQLSVLPDPIETPPDIAEAEPPVVTPDTAPGTVLSPAEADRFYAATGVWLRAPRMVVLPSGEVLGDVSTVGADRALITRATTSTLPSGGLLFPDTGLRPQLDPPAADVVFERDARGLLLATPEGTRTPYGMLIYAGQPNLVPPTRPGTIAPEPVIEPEPITDLAILSAPENSTTPDFAAAPDLAATPDISIAPEPTQTPGTLAATTAPDALPFVGPTATPPAPVLAEVVPDVTPEPETTTPTDEDIVTATLQALINEQLSDTLTPEIAETVTDTVTRDIPLDTRGLIAATPEGTGTDGLIVFAGLPAVIPPTRPGTEQPTALVPEVAVQPIETTPVRDARGLITATSEGTITDGLIVYAGSPSLVPPTRTGTAAPTPEIIAAPVETTPNLDARGLIAATADGAGTDGLIVFAGAPSVVPPSRPATQAPEPEVIVETAPSLDTRGLLIATAEGTQTDGLIVFAGLPSVVPPTRPVTQAPSPDITPETDLSDLETTPTNPETTPEVTPGGVSFTGLRPPQRPQALVIPAVALPLPSYTGTRPSTRPAGLAPEATETVEPALPEIDNTTVATTLATIVAATSDPLAGATTRAVPIARVPAPRPTNFARVVAAAEARQASVAATTTARAPEPEAVSSAAAQPSGPVPRSVASAATIESVINLRQINLIGVYGRPNDRRALVRLANGRYVRVSVGDRLDGGQVTAIGDNVINYVKRGQTIALGVPG